MTRFANQKIAELVDYVSTPISQKTKEYNPYFYGMDEKRWRQGQNKLHAFIGSSKRGTDDLASELSKTANLPFGEAKELVRYSRIPGNTVSRHVSFGVPHAYASVELARRALVASGTPAHLDQYKHHQATDLEVMVGKVKQLMDVQNRYIYPGRDDMLALGIMQNVKNNGGGRAWKDATGDTPLVDIIDNAINMSEGNYHSDKFMQERGIDGIQSDKVKDFLITSRYNKSKVNNLVEERHGHYNPTAPDSGMSVLDMDTLRDNLYPMTKRELIGLGGQPIRDDSKLKLQIPINRLIELSRSDRSKGLISDEVNDQLRQLRT